MVPLILSCRLAGPNTGGKTASLKALGLAALMAKAGLFLPVKAATEGGGQRPQLLWFDKVGSVAHQPPTLLEYARMTNWVQPASVNL